MTILCYDLYNSALLKNTGIRHVVLAPPEHRAARPSPSLGSAEGLGVFALGVGGSTWPHKGGFRIKIGLGFPGLLWAGGFGS